MEKRVLIVDDEPDIRELLEITLGRMGLSTNAAHDLAAAKQLLGEHRFDLCLTDMNLPDGNGIELVALIARQHPDLPVAMITAYGNMDTAIDALKSGAFDFVQKPVDLEQLRSLVEKALKLTDETTAGSAELLGRSDVILAINAQLKKLARSQAPIYISGESGSGKEVAARLMHEQGPRCDGPFVPVNCGAIPSELMESEFFGHQKGSFTGAVSDKDGLFAVAAGGTLFLDEVADLPLSMQVKLLRAIQEKSIRPVGSTQEQPIDVRVLSATHKDLADEVQAGHFRQDLYYRLNVIEVRMPALRERSEDIPLHAERILDRLAQTYDSEVASIAEDAFTALVGYDFPGNVRELENILERAYTLCEDNVIQVADLGLDAAMPPSPPTSPSESVVAPSADEGDDTEMASASLQPGESLEAHLEKIERQLITNALEEHKWNKTAAAKALGITFRALRYRLKKLEME